MTVYAYIRVSTELQNCANQIYEIKNYAHKNDLHIDRWIEETISSQKSLEKRKFGRLLKKLKENDIVISTEISRFGRNMLEVMGILQQCLEKNCQIITLKENYHLGSDIQSKVLAFAFSLASEIERQLISQRTLESLHRLKQEGKHLGRPFGKGWRKLCNKHNKIVELLNKKIAQKEIAKTLDCSTSTLNRYIMENIRDKGSA